MKRIDEDTEPPTRPLDCGMWEVLLCLMGGFGVGGACLDIPV